MDPRMRIGAIVAEGLDGSSRSAEMKSKIATLLDKVGIPSSYATLFPHELSGGQRQRVAIARALALDPRVLVADEPVSALDVSMRGQVLNLLMSLQRDLNLTIVFISHDLGIVQQLCNRVAVMYQGKIVEMGDPGHIFQNPKDEYTKQLVTSIPKVPSA
jgi:ABC-type oligopeptide transport system ATPase subunit